MPQFNLNDYVDVQQRIRRFWDEHPDGAIRTHLESDPDNFDTCRYRAEVYKHRDSTAPDATGYAFEKAGSGMANKTAHEENCETSAIGRALANMGYATSGKDRPSRQEMRKTSPEAAGSPQSDETINQVSGEVVDYSDDKQWQAASRTLHATAKNVIGGDDPHAALHLMATKAGFPSIKNMPVKRLLKLNEYIQSDDFTTYYDKHLRPELPQPQQETL